MSQELLDQNIAYLRSVEILDLEEKQHNENAYHYIANSTADIGHKLSDNDIIFTFFLERDVRLVEKEVEDEETGELKRKLVKDPAGIVDSLHIGILTQGNKFFNYTIDLGKVIYGHAHLIGISKLTIKDVQPNYTFYNQESDFRYRKYSSLDHLFLLFEEINETIKLHGHTYRGNKTLYEMSRILFQKIQ